MVLRETQQPAPSHQPVLELSGISKTYGPVVANQDVSLSLDRGSVHAVLGENGAGKSTLMKILFGVEQPDSGEISISGTSIAFRAPRDAIAAGIGMVFQHFGLVQELTALDNISLGAEITGPWGVRRSVGRQRITALATELALDVPLDRRIDELSVGQQQRVEILKALYRGARILILDEPTALLTPQERLGLFEAIKRLQAGGTSVLFITHKLEEAEHLADDVTVMRLGRVVARHTIGAVTRDQLVADMVGQTTVTTIRPTRSPGDLVLSARDISASTTAGLHPLTEVSVNVRRGEIVGVVGIDGHGHQQLCQIVAGVIAPTTGTLSIDGNPQPGWNRRRSLANGVSYVPEDRLSAGVARDVSISENLISNRLGDADFIRAGFLRQAHISSHADDMITAFDIRCRDREQPVARLSGGNVQKVVLARELSVSPDVIVVCEPTRGLDIGAIANVHQQLFAAATRGAGVLFQSSDLDEVLTVVDRVIVFREGLIVGEFTNNRDLDAATIGAAMLNAQSPSGGVAA